MSTTRVGTASRSHGSEQPREADVPDRLRDERDLGLVRPDRGERLAAVLRLRDEPQIAILPDHTREAVEEERMAVAHHDIDHDRPDPMSRAGFRFSDVASDR